MIWRIIAAIAFAICGTTAHAAVTSVQFGADRTASPWNICVYDSTNTCRTFMTLPSTGGGALIPPQYGGTGVNNGTNTLTLGGILATTGTGATTLAFPNSTATFTYPPASDTLVGLAATQTLNNKTLGSPIITGSATFNGSSSGTVTVQAQAVAGSPSINWPTTGGTVATNATSPIVVNSGTGNISCPTCLTGGGGAFTATLPLQITGSNIALNIGTGLAQSGGNLNLQPSQLATIGGVNAIGAVSNEWIDSISTAGVPHLSQPSAANLSNGVTGSGSVVLATSPTLVTPNLGTPSAVTLTHGTGLPISTGVSGLGTGVAAALAIAPNSSGGVATYPYAATNLSGLGTGVGTALGNAVTGSGSIVLSTSPSLTTPSIAGAALSGTISGTPTLSGANFIVNNNLAQMNAGTLKGNATTSTANASDFTITGLTNLSSPDMTLDKLLIQNHTTGQLENVSASQLFGSVGNVTGVNGLVGSLTVTDNGGASVNSSGTTITFGSPGGMLNRFRNSAMDVDQRGATVTSPATNTYTLDGWIVYLTGSGCAVTVTQQTGPENGAEHFLQVAYTGGTCSDVKIGQRIESSIAAPLAGKQVLAQFFYKQTTGSAVTPYLISCYAGATAPDNFNGTSGSYCGNNNTFTTADLSSTALSSCATATWCSEAYSWAANASAYKGYEVDFDLGALTTGQNAAIATPDIRVTPGVSTGIVPNPPPPELRAIPVEMAFCQRYYQVLNGLYFDGTPGTGNPLGMGLPLPVTMRVTPTSTQTGTPTTSGLSSGTLTINSTNQVPGMIMIQTASASSTTRAFWLSNNSAALDLSSEL